MGSKGASQGGKDIEAEAGGQAIGQRAGAKGLMGFARIQKRKEAKWLEWSEWGRGHKVTWGVGGGC